MIKTTQTPFQSVIEILPERLRMTLAALRYGVQDEVTEIRLRSERPISLSCRDKNYYVTSQGAVTASPNASCLTVHTKEMDEMVLKLCDYSLHSHQNDLVQGFVTIKGGHRAGLCGSAAIQKSEITGVKYISSINLRVAREVIGCSKDLLSRVFQNGLKNILIAGSPASGKTTLLRDLCRSLGQKYRIALMDERSEIASITQGIPQYDIGSLTDVLDGYPKSVGIMTAIRTLAPQLIVCDEIGTYDDLKAVESGTNSGIHILASVHAANEKELLQKQSVAQMILEGAFDTVVFLESGQMPGKISKIISAGDFDVKNSRKYPDYCFVHDIRDHAVDGFAKESQNIGANDLYGR